MELQKFKEARAVMEEIEKIDDMLYCFVVNDGRSLSIDLIDAILLKLGSKDFSYPAASDGYASVTLRDGILKGTDIQQYKDDFANYLYRKAFELYAKFLGI